MAFYWPVSSLPQGVALTGDGGNNLLAAFYIQTDAKDLNVMYHNAKVASMLWRFTGRYLHCHRALP
ncbi:DUF6645 domain-containing protein [Escherichia coli]|uniref:DUF6645 domain-containing protein n=1 Tax=Escherichia coli TaxID=562 RepID=UPI00352F4CDD